MGQQCEQYGYRVKYFFARQYKWMLPDQVLANSTFVGNSKDLVSSLTDGLSVANRRQLDSAFRKNRPDYIYMHNIQPLLNLHIAKLAKKYHSVFIQHIHEPYFEDKRVHGSFYQQWWWYLFEYIQGILLNNSDVAVLSSNTAISLFEKRYQHFRGQKVKVPLLYQDLGRSEITNTGRKYITFIGPPVPSKGTGTFLHIAEEAAKRDLGLDFLLISRKIINDPDILHKSNIKIFYKEKISDEEIGYFIRNSLMTITPYRTAKQSSAALTSYMYGTPVISTNVGGLPEVVQHLKTGYLIDLNSGVEEWINGINYIKNNLARMSGECRNYFAANCSDVNWPKYFSQLFPEKRPQK